MTKQELSARLDAFEAALAAYGVTKFTAKEIWDLRAEIVEEIRNVEFSDPAERKDLWQRLQDGMDMLKQKSALLQVENEAFATEAEERIDALHRPSDAAAPEKDWTKEELAALRAQASDLFDFLRQNRWPSQERRKTVWDRFTAARDRIKAMEDALYARVRAAIEERKASSAAIAAPFRSALEACKPATALEDLPKAIDAVVSSLPAAEPVPFATITRAFADGSAAKVPLKMKATACVRSVGCLPSSAPASARKMGRRSTPSSPLSRKRSMPPGMHTRESARRSRTNGRKSSRPLPPCFQRSSKSGKRISPTWKR